MDTSGNLPVSESTARRLKSKGQRKKRPGRPSKSSAANAAPRQAAAGTLTRTKALLLAALRVWELKQRIGG